MFILSLLKKYCNNRSTWIKQRSLDKWWVQCQVWFCMLLQYHTYCDCPLVRHKTKVESIALVTVIVSMVLVAWSEHMYLIVCTQFVVYNYSLRFLKMCKMSPKVKVHKNNNNDNNNNYNNLIHSSLNRNKTHSGIHHYIDENLSAFWSLYLSMYRFHRNLRVYTKSSDVQAMYKAHSDFPLYISSGFCH